MKVGAETNEPEILFMVAPSPNLRKVEFVSAPAPNVKVPLTVTWLLAKVLAAETERLLTVWIAAKLQVPPSRFKDVVPAKAKVFVELVPERFIEILLVTPVAPSVNAQVLPPVVFVPTGIATGNVQLPLIITLVPKFCNATPTKFTNVEVPSITAPVPNTILPALPDAVVPVTVPLTNNPPVMVDVVPVGVTEVSVPPFIVSVPVIVVNFEVVTTTVAPLLMVKFLIDVFVVEAIVSVPDDTVISSPATKAPPVMFAGTDTVVPSREVVPETVLDVCA